MAARSTSGCVGGKKARRRWDGAFVVQPNEEDRRERNGLRYLGMGPGFTTAGIGLAYLAASGELRLHEIGRAHV